MASINLSQSSATSGTGIDVTSVVDQILTAERAPERIWQQQQAALSTQASTLNVLSSQLQALQTKAYALTDLSGALSSQTVSSSASGIAAATAKSGAVAGVHTLVVQKLATVSSYYTDAVASSSTTLGAGTISLGVGSASHDIVVDDTNNTLDKLAAYINKQDYGVQTSVVNDNNGARLALVSKSSGAAGDLNVTANPSTLVFNKSASGVDARFTLDGVPLTSSTNTVTSSIPNVTLNLLSEAPTTAVTLTIAPDSNGITQAVNGFVSAYNSAIKSINSQFQVDASNSAGPLAGNSTLRSLQGSLLSDVTFSVAGNNGIVNLASMGIDMADDGTLSVDNTKLSAAVSGNFPAVQNFFQSVAADGFGKHLSSSLSSMVDPSSGLLAININENTSNQKMLTKTISDFEDHLTARRQLLTTQYAQVDAMLRQYPLTIQQLQAQLGTTSTSK